MAKPEGVSLPTPYLTFMSMLPPRVTSTAPAEPAAATAASEEPAIRNFFIFSSPYYQFQISLLSTPLKAMDQQACVSGLKHEMI